MTDLTTFRFWVSEKYGLIRQRSGAGWLAHPEIWKDGRWVKGSPYVMDAITGMGEDQFSCGEWADEIVARDAEIIANEKGISLYAPQKTAEGVGRGHGRAET